MKVHDEGRRLWMVCTAIVLFGFACQGCRGNIVSGSGGGPGGSGGPPISPTGDHPRLWFGDAATLARAKAWYQANKATLSWRPDANDPTLNALHSVLAGDADQTNCSGGSGCNCTTAINWLLNPGINVNEDNYARWAGEQLVLIYDWCHNQMTPAQLGQSMAYLNAFFGKWNQPSYLGTTTKWMPSDNPWWGHLRNSIEWGIASFGENPQAQDFLDNGIHLRYEQVFLPFAMTDGKGGVPGQGTEYGPYELGYPVVPFYTERLLNRDLYGATNFFKEAVFFVIYSATPAPTPNPTNSNSSYQQFGFEDDGFFKDGGQFLSPRTDLGSFMNAAANIWRDIGVGKYARHFLNAVRPDVPLYAISTDQPGEDKDFSSLPLDYYGPGMGYLYTRNKWGADATSVLLQMKGATGTGDHYHEDTGSFQIWRNGQWLSRETTGYGDAVNGFNNTTTSGAPAGIAHNVLLFNGAVQTGYQHGQATPGPYDYAVGPAVVQRIESNPSYAYAAEDLSPSYHSTDANYDNPAAKTALREYVFVKPLETLVTFDRMESAAGQPTTKTFLMHALTPPALAGNTATVTVGSQALQLTTVVPAQPAYRIIDETANGGTAGIGQQRLELDSDGAYFLNVMQARDASGAALTVSLNETSTTFEVTLTHPTLGTALVVFNKGTTAPGGSFGFAASGTPGTTPFIDHIQGFAVTDDGPTWSPR